MFNILRSPFYFLRNVFSNPKPFFFLFFNVILPGLDVGTDFATFLALLTLHPWWATLTLTWMFVPFLIHLGEFAYDLCKNGKDTGRDRLNPMFHFPFFLPVRNLWNAWKLNHVRFGTSRFNLSNSAKVEAILKEVGLAGLAESFFEAGPQSVTQLIIFLSTGQLSKTQIVSIIVSILSLTWGASRAYFIQRQEDAADPDPALVMVVLRVFPFMLVIVIHSLMMWICIGGFIGPYSFIALGLNFLVVLAILKISIRKNATSGKEKTKTLRQALQLEEKVIMENENSEKEEIEMLVPQLGGAIKFEEQVIMDKEVVPTQAKAPSFEEQVNMEGGTASTKEKPQSFLVKASLFAVWVPCVIGANPKMYITSAITSMATKVVLLTIAVAMASLGLQDYVQPNHFLLWCQEEASIDHTGNVCSFTNQDFSNCFNSTQSSIVQKIRICSGDEIYLRLYLLLWLLTSTLLSIAATYRLHRIANYEKLYRVSKNILWCIPTTPIVHRSLIFNLIERDNATLLDEIVKEADKLSSEFLNRPNRSGDTPLDFASNFHFHFAGFLLNAWALSNSRYGMKHPVENLAFSPALTAWITAGGDDNKETDKKIKALIKTRGFLIPSESAPMDEQESLRRNIESWNKSHTEKC